MKIYVDAMGGDQAPSSVLAGVELAIKEVKADLVLLGDESILGPYLSRLKHPKLSLLHCPETIEMAESPVQAVRSKKNSTIVRGLRECAATSDSAFFSAGHSGAVFAAALMTMGRLASIERPAIAAELPTLRGSCILVDAGANVDCRPNHFVDFALMGTIYAKIRNHHDRPKVGILSNGEEESKGTELTRQAHALLKEDLRVDYVGYVEGKEIFQGDIDVVVTDGFTGNVVLKSLEGLGKAVSQIIRTELGRSFFSKLGAIASMPALKRVQKKLDYAEVGSAPLLGVDGNCFIGHGRSSPRAIKNGILRAQEAVGLGLYEQLRALYEQKKA